MTTLRGWDGLVVAAVSQPAQRKVLWLWQISDPVFTPGEAENEVVFRTERGSWLLAGFSLQCAHPGGWYFGIAAQEKFSRDPRSLGAGG